MNTWPELDLVEWRDSYATLLLYTQIVGKVRQTLTPKLNQWWNVPLYVTTRGLTTSAMPAGEKTISVDFDFIAHQLVLEDSQGGSRHLPLEPRSVAEFYSSFMAELAALGVQLEISRIPQECPVTTPFDRDHEHASYDPERVQRFWQVLRRVEPVFQAFRARYRGKCSPVHFFWGAFDLAVSRFNGRRAPSRAAKVDRDAYDEEVISLGFWPGDPWAGNVEAMFYSYTVPEPKGLAEQSVRPGAAFFSSDLREFLLPYSAVRAAADPAALILEFAESCYDAGSSLAGWDRAALAYP